MNQLIGHFHPLIVHLPIGILLLAIFFTFLAQKELFQALKAAIPLSFLLGAIVATASCITGYVLSTNGDYEGETVQNHQWLGIATAVLSFVAYFVTRSNNNASYNRFSKIIIGILGILLIATGHLGGNLTHGPGYLFNIKSSTITEKNTNQTPPQYSDNTVVYNDIIQPILIEKCALCHNESKQKGKLRLDQADFFKKGGEHGAIFVAGRPEESEMIKRLLLPLEHKEHMPPKEKPQLTEEEKTRLRWWVEQGADFHKPVKEYPNLNAVVAHTSISTTSPLSYLPDVKVGQPAKQAIEALQKMNIIALPISKNNPMLSVNFINNANIYAAKPHIQKLSKNIIWIKLADSTVMDTSLTILGGLENLTKLYLDRTKITDKGLKSLSQLKNLMFLNIVGTGVTKDGVSTLIGLPKLKKLFVYQTAITLNDATYLKTILPNVEIDLGNYQVLTLNNDTTLLMPPPKK